MAIPRMEQSPQNGTKPPVWTTPRMNQKTKVLKARRHPRRKEPRKTKDRSAKLLSRSPDGEKQEKDNTIESVWRLASSIFVRLGCRRQNLTISRRSPSSSVFQEEKGRSTTEKGSKRCEAPRSKNKPHRVTRQRGISASGEQSHAYDKGRNTPRPRCRSSTPPPILFNKRSLLVHVNPPISSLSCSAAGSLPRLSPLPLSPRPSRPPTSIPAGKLISLFF